MAYIKVTSDVCSIKVDFGDYTDPQSPNFNQQVYDRIDGLKPIYKRENLVLIWEDKYNSKLTWLRMKESMANEEWALTHDQTFDPVSEGVEAFIISDINGTTTWADRDAFENDLRSLMK